MVIVLDFVAGAVAGGLAAVGVRLAVERWRRRPGPAPIEPAIAGEPARVPEPRRPEPAPPRIEVVPHAPRTAATADDEPLRTSERIVLHILRQGRVGPHEVAPYGMTQGGIIEALGIRQGSVSKALARLAAAGVLRASRRHVEHYPRRLNVYELTPLGETLARDLRRRRAGAPAELRSRPDDPIQLRP